jgi:leader peptidase (prepilin peptidase)/N-methyltransferase
VTEAPIFIFGLGVALVFGLAIGSFLNVVIWRVPAGRSVVSPPSACTSCGTPIAPRDNVPVLSWLLLRGRCRRCETSISARYPVVEAVTGIAFVLVIVGASVPAYPLAFALPLLYFVAMSIALALIDLDTHTLPNKIVLPSYLAVAGLLVIASALEADWVRLLTAALGMIVLFGFYFLLAMISPRGMGFGDVKLAGVIGMLLGWLGWAALVVGGFSAFLLGGVFSILLIAAKRVHRKGGIPFGPWMIAGAFVGVAVGDPLIEWYLSSIGIR